MAFHRRAGSRFTASIWPGFVDAITALLMVMIFVLTIFMIVQFVLSETINNQDDELNALNAQLNDLASALGLEQSRAAELEQRVATLGASLSEAEGELQLQAALIASLTAETEAQSARIADFEDQVTALLAANADLTLERDAVQADLDARLTEVEALNLALAAARSEIDAAAEAARLAAAEREAMEALIADLEGSRRWSWPGWGPPTRAPTRPGRWPRTGWPTRLVRPRAGPRAEGVAPSSAPG